MSDQLKWEHEMQGVLSASARKPGKWHDYELTGIKVVKKNPPQTQFPNLNGAQRRLTFNENIVN